MQAKEMQHKLHICQKKLKRKIDRLLKKKHQQQIAEKLNWKIKQMNKVVKPKLILQKKKKKWWVRGTRRSMGTLTLTQLVECFV